MVGSRRVFWSWFVDEIIYIILPIFVLVGIEIHTRGGVDKGFLAIREWSFANILLFGISIKRAFQLGTRNIGLRKYEATSFVEVLILLLIGASMIMSIIMLADGRRLIKFPLFIETAQMVIFAIGVWSVYFTYKLEADLHHSLNGLPADSDARRYFLYLKSEVAQCEENVRRYQSCVEKCCNEILQHGNYSSNADHIEDLAHVFNRIGEKSSRAAEDLKAAVDKIRTEHHKKVSYSQTTSE